MTNEELKALALAANKSRATFGAGIPHREAFRNAATPAAVLGLIADNESLTKNYKSLCDSVAHLNDAATSASDEVARLKAECEGLRKVMACVVNEVPRYTHRDGNAPGHCHSVPGIWDGDNGAKAGTECGWCKVWNAAVAMSKEASND